MSDHVLHAFRFADHDLFMHFHGGSVGHKATNSFTQLFESQGESGDASDGNNDDVSEHQPGDLEEAQEQEEEDYEYKIRSGSKGEDGGSDDEEMGPEDREEPWEMGDLQAEGFDELWLDFLTIIYFFGQWNYNTMKFTVPKLALVQQSEHLWCFAGTYPCVISHSHTSLFEQGYLVILGKQNFNEQYVSR